jgi:PAS domain S-box-containing protein
LAEIPVPSVARHDLAEATVLADVCDQFDDAFIWVDDGWRVRAVNTAAAVWGIACHRLIGQVLWQGAPKLVGSRLEALMRRSMSAREPFEATLPWADGEARQFAIRCFPLGLGLGLTFRDVTAQMAQDAAIREREARFRAIATSAPTLLWMTRADASFEFANQALLDFTGAPPELLLGPRPPMMLIHPDDRADVERLRDEAFARQAPHEIVARVGNASGEWRWLRIVNRPRLDADGRFLGYIATAIDVTELRQAELRQRLLVNELNHRVKNTLATVQSLAQQTLRPGVEPQAAREQFLDRLLSLSAVHNVLNRECWQGADLLEIAAMTLRPYADAGQIHVRGCSVGLAPNVALAMAIALRELADNAVRHGALSQPAGRVRLAWTSRRGDPTVRLRWRERGGPPAKPPSRRGFGVRLLTDGLRGELGAPADLDIQAPGFTWTVTVPVPQGSGGEAAGSH